MDVHFWDAGASMSPELAEEFRSELERRVRAEARHGWDAARRRWDKPLGERVEAGRAIGGLEISSIEMQASNQLVHFHPSVEDMAVFREGDRVRLSLNAPDGEGFLDATFYGLTEKGLTVSLARTTNLPEQRGWTLDESILDLSDFYLRALAELATTAHGREIVLPALLEGVGDEIDFAAHGDFCDLLADEKLDESQQNAVACCLAAERFHLVQGPPGTGKTQTLALLVRALVDQGQRVLVTAFTHRAIHHALRKISPLVSCPVYKVSDTVPNDAEGIDFKTTFDDTGLLDHPGPYVIGATPFALFSSRAGEARFDVAVIDETSQMRVEAAVMAMLRAERWFFFGDRQQLPPIVLRPVDDAAEDSIFARLAGCCDHTMLQATYRMNAPLTEWPSKTFYGGGLIAAEPNSGHRFRLKSLPKRELLGPEPAMVRVEIDHENRRSSSPEEADEIAVLIEEMLIGGLAPGEIGVVVPFRAQAARVRNILRFPRFAKWSGIGALTVDTVERFQGQEREAMIVSFVVSDTAFMDRLADFLIYPQRLNVAVTRARTKVVLVHSRRFREWLQTNASHHANAEIALSLLAAAGK